MNSALLFIPSPDHVAMLDGGPGGMRVPLAVRDPGGLWVESGHQGRPHRKALILRVDGEIDRYGWMTLWLHVYPDATEVHWDGLETSALIRKAAGAGLGRFIEVRDGEEVTRG